MRYRRIAAGFGLIEQIVVLIVLAILAAFAVPTFSRMIDNHDLFTAQTDFMAVLQHARSLAVNRQMPIVLCPSRDATTCTSDGDWSRGWLIGRDNGNGALEGAPIQVGDERVARLHIFGSDNKKTIRFSPEGTAANSFQTLTLCVRGKNDRALLVVVSRIGRIRGEIASASDLARCEGS